MGIDKMKYRRKYVRFNTILRNESNLFDFARGWIFVAYSC